MSSASPPGPRERRLRPCETPVSRPRGHAPNQCALAPPKTQGAPLRMSKSTIPGRRLPGSKEGERDAAVLPPGVSPNQMTALAAGLGNQAFGALLGRTGGPGIARAPVVTAAPASHVPLEAELAHTAAVRRSLARDPATQELRDAADAAQKTDTISKAAGGVTN